MVTELFVVKAPRDERRIRWTITTATATQKAAGNPIIIARLADLPNVSPLEPSLLPRTASDSTSRRFSFLVSKVPWCLRWCNACDPPKR